MNTVSVSAREISLPQWSSSVRDFAVKVLNKINRGNWDLSILLCGDKTISELNAQYRGKPQATDILSFCLGETVKEGDSSVYLPGDIVISLDTLRENAELFKVPQDEELRRLIIHGILHLDGMDHKTNGKNEPMLILQEEILNSLKDERILTGPPDTGGKN